MHTIRCDAQTWAIMAYRQASAKGRKVYVLAWQHSGRLSLDCACLCRKLSPPIPPNTKIGVVMRNDSSAAAYSFSQWLAVAGNHSWTGGVNKTLPGFPGAKIVSGGSAVTTFIGNTPFSIGWVA